MSYISSIGTANPPHKFTQSQIADFMVAAMNLDEDEAQHLKVLYRASGIDTRHSVISDYGSTGKFNFYSNENNLEPFPTTKRRLDLYQEHALQLSKEAILTCLNQVPQFTPLEITHLITVSCTGMFAPGLDIDLIHELHLNPSVQRTNITFMGCYAAFNALRVADSFCASNPQAKVLIVCTELCSIHFQKENTEDNKLANALFADGSAAILLESNARKKKTLQVDKFFCDLATEGEKDMAWTIGDQGFEMKLSTYVPDAIQNGIGKLTARLLQLNEIRISDISYFAIHPGGKRILEVIESELGLAKEDNRFAYAIMKRFGNMSSPTVLFVLKEIMDQLTEKDEGKKILSFGFGPGLTLESLILTVKANS